MSDKKLLKRQDVPAEFTWNTADIFENDDAWEKAFASLDEYEKKCGSFAGKLGTSEGLLSFLKFYDEINVLLSKIFGYASLKSDQDTANTLYQSMKGRASSKYVAISGSLSYSVPEIMAIPDETLRSFYLQKPELEIYRRNIEQITRRKAHILSQECELILARAGELTQAPETVQSIFENGEVRFGTVVSPEGEKITVTGANFTHLLENPDRNFRKKVFRKVYHKFGEYKNTFSALLDAQFKSLLFMSTSRNYASTLEASLDVTEVPVEVYHNLIKAVHDNFDKMYRYVRLRKKLLKVPEIHMYDVYTPLVPEADSVIPFDEAKKTVLKALSVLGDDYIAMLKEGFGNRWIDIYPNEGKRGGAYSSGLSDPHPYVLLNHVDSLDSCFTLAHEMGHALHSYLSIKNQPVCTSDYVIFVAEVASTVNEVLTMKYLLSKTKDKISKAYLINHFLDQFKGTVYRQTMFAEFELFMGELTEKGQTLTSDILCKKYLELNKEYFGPDMVADDEISLEWARIPHFYYNYYVFQYATGFSAAVAIANRILSEGKSAVDDYKKFLSSGCSKDPISLLKIAGVDMSTPKPVNEALKLFGELTDELEALDI